MARISLGGGRWYDQDTCTRYEESRTWDGRNHISDATGSQWDHEALYLTPRGTYVLHSWSAWQGSRASDRIVSAEEAHAWLIAMGHYGAVPTAVVAAGEV